MIKKEKQRRNVNSLQLLGKALVHGGVLEGHMKDDYINKNDKALLADTFFQKYEKAEEDRKRLLENL